jgi:hypothetical protein
MSSHVSRIVSSYMSPGQEVLEGRNFPPVRPVLISLQRLPFRDFTIEEFLGRTIFSCRGSPCVSAFKGSTLRLGQMADACISARALRAIR